MATQAPTQSVAAAPSTSATSGHLGSPNQVSSTGVFGSFDPANVAGPEAAHYATTGTQLAVHGHAAIRVDTERDEEAAPEETLLRLTAPCARLPVALAVSVPVRDFRVRNLLAMTAGEVIQTQWGHGEDLPLSSGDVQLAWSEFEVIDTRLAVRVTRLA